MKKGATKPAFYEKGNISQQPFSIKNGAYWLFTFDKSQLIPTKKMSIIGFTVIDSANMAASLKGN